MNMQEKLRFSEKSDILFLVKYILLVFFSFFAFYSVSNMMGTLRNDHYHAYLNWELVNIPLIPEFIIIYVSAYLQLLVPIFYLTKAQIRKYAHGLIFVTIVAGIIFNVFPSVQGFPRLAQVPRLNDLFQLLYLADPPHNMFPSLHITYSTMTSMIIRHCLEVKWQRYFLYGWQVCLYFSVLFVHQHHLFDVFTGLILATVGIRLFGYHKIYSYK